tara:strand:+ start:8167 stop:8685 length:519 start_codon:yes stop_codon:yes gene_type:complete
VNSTDQQVAETSAVTQDWLSMLRRYLGFVAVANLMWEVLHLPLYTLWNEGSLAEQAFAVLHCTGGDLLISLSALVIALALVGNHRWPREGFQRVVIITIMIGVVYTVYSERLNTLVRESWAYSEWMPVIPVFEVGLSPITQWLIIPPLAFWWSRQPLGSNTSHSRGRIDEKS